MIQVALSSYTQLELQELRSFDLNISAAPLLMYAMPLDFATATSF
ncbi:MAG: hypothetical protein ACE1S7_06365 [Candidatus Tisiphia sp.]